MKDKIKLSGPELGFVQGNALAAPPLAALLLLMGLWATCVIFSLAGILAWYMWYKTDWQLFND